MAQILEPPPAPPLAKLHLAVTAALLVALVAVAGLALSGRVHFGTPAAPAAATEPQPTGKEGRYRIEKVEDDQLLLDSAGKLNFFGTHILEAWVFKYQGGYVQVHLETEVDGKPRAGDPLPNNWPSLLGQDEAIKEDKAVAFEKQGYIILTAIPSALSVEDAALNYQEPLGALLANSAHGPLQSLLPLHMEVRNQRPYRLFLSANPMPKQEGAGFNLWAENELPIHGPLVARHMAGEPYHQGGGKNLEAGKNITLLERQRGYSKFRLVARFLGDGEVRDHARSK